MLTNDVAILSNHYNDNGYVEHKIDDPVILRGRDGLEVVFRVNEGPQYRVGKVEIGGELIQDGRQMLKSVKLTTGQIFRGSRLREDVTTPNGYVLQQRLCFCPSRSDYKGERDGQEGRRGVGDYQRPAGVF